LFGRASAQLTAAAEPAHKFTRANDFMDLAALLRNNFQAARILSDAERRDHRRISFSASTSPKSAKTKQIFRQAK
jgi:hypothetical protein